MRGSKRENSGRVIRFTLSENANNTLEGWNVMASLFQHISPEEESFEEQMTT